MVNEDEWIEWRGGKQPVGDHAVVRVRLHSGEQCCDRAYNLDWEHNRFGFDHMDDIERYQVAEA